MGGGTNIQSKLEFSDINRNRRLGQSPRSPCAGVATGLNTQPKKHQEHQEHSLKNSIKNTA